MWGVDYSFTLAHYKYAFEVGRNAIRDTTLLAVVSTPIAGILGMVVAYLVVRKKFIGRGFINLRRSSVFPCRVRLSASDIY